MKCFYGAPMGCGITDTRHAWLSCCPFSHILSRARPLAPWATLNIYSSEHTGGINVIVYGLGTSQSRYDLVCHQSERREEPQC